MAEHAWRKPVRFEGIGPDDKRYGLRIAVEGGTGYASLLASAIGEEEVAWAYLKEPEKALLAVQWLLDLSDAAQEAAAQMVAASRDIFASTPYPEILEREPRLAKAVTEHFRLQEEARVTPEMKEARRYLDATAGMPTFPPLAKPSQEKPEARIMEEVADGPQAE